MVEIRLTETNVEINQDRVADTVEHFREFGYVMFPQQRRIYELLAEKLEDKTVVEVGCGNGLGTAILSNSVFEIVGTDKLLGNVNFAKCMYPWINFGVWDIQKPIPRLPSVLKVSSVVCVETIEHVANPEKAIQNLIDAATEEVWISTPNGRGKKRPPDNPYHVCEYTPEEMLIMIRDCSGWSQTEVLHWETFKFVSTETDVDPLVYRILL